MTVTLRQFAESDRADLARLERRPEVMRFIGRLTPSAVYTEDGLRSITVDGAFAGVAGLVKSGVDGGAEVEIICALLPQFEHRGVATAACRHILTSTRRHRVLATISDENVGAAALAGRLGFTHTGRSRQSGEHIWIWESPRAT